MDDAATPRTADPASPGVPSARRYVVASVVGNALEWYDFFLYATAASIVFGQLFFPAVGDPLIATLASLAGLTVGFLARPFGGVVFGHIGDRFSRRSALVATLCMMGVATFLIGLLPTYATAGAWAPVLLVALRIVQGIAAGGEWGGAVLMISENVPAERRGFLSAWSQAGLALGFVLSSGVFLLTQLSMGEQAFLDWGWRIPFLISLVIVGVGAYIRFRIPTDQVGGESAHGADRPRLPVVEVVRTHRRSLLLAMALRIAENGGAYIFLTFALAYGAHVGVPQELLLLGVMLSMTFAVGTMLLFGHLSDRIGRRPVYAGGALGLAVLAFPFFWMLDTTVPALVLLAFFLGNGVFHAAMIGVQPAYFTELFSPEVRYSGLSLAHELAAVLAGGLSPLIATALLAATGSSVPIALYVIGLAAITLIALLVSRHRSHGETTGPAPTAAAEDAR